jgi:hypothetical protein
MKTARLKSSLKVTINRRTISIGNWVTVNDGNFSDYLEGDDTINGVVISIDHRKQQPYEVFFAHDKPLNECRQWFSAQEILRAGPKLTTPTRHVTTSASDQWPLI